MMLKRFFDVVLSALSMVVFAIPVAIIYLCIRMEDGGPAFYSQERIGYRGRPFKLYKFRSMVPQAEHDDNPHLCEENDNRLTRVGRFLRDHHLDEFPQLWNIFIGDMSFVGPRPEVRVSSRWQRSTTAIPTRSRRCCADWRWTSTT